MSGQERRPSRPLIHSPHSSGGSSRGGGSGSNNHNQDSLSPSSPSPSIDSSSSDNIPQDRPPVLTNPKTLKTGKSTLSNSVSDEVPILAGERIEAVYKDLTYLSAYANQGALKGTLTVTNYKLYFR